MFASKMIRTAAALLAASAACATAQAEDLVAIGLTLTGHQTLVGIDSHLPTLPLFNRVITGVEAGFRIRALDYRPADGKLYAIAVDVDARIGRVYTIDIDTAVAIPLQEYLLPDADWCLAAGIGLDLDPVLDLLVSVTSENCNLVIDPATGLLVSADLELSFEPGDVHHGLIPAIFDIAFDHSTPCSGSAQQFGLDLDLEALIKIDGDTGLLETVGSLDLHAPLGLHRLLTKVSGLDISGETDVAYAMLSTQLFGALGLPIDLLPLQALFTIDLSTGHATSLGLIDLGLLNLDALAVINVDFSGEPCCPSRANLDGDGALTIFDFLIFQNQFEVGDPAADFNSDGTIDLFDFLEYQNVFQAGCFG